MTTGTRTHRSRLVTGVKYVVLSLAAIAIASVVGLTISDPAYRVKLLGAWGYQRWTTLDQKIALINESALGGSGVVVPMGTDLAPIPYAGEVIGVERTSPIVELSLARGTTKTNLAPNPDGTYTYVSDAYPIQLTIATETVPGDPLPLLRVRVSAKARE